ncbi:hypothetical protein PoB_006615900 [Plakobranchus ocellatus]|uniref:Uncharacterized protein n=1 Tax=Plakobranchus ocellatus TaxID=259542 RepID=A0AAV4D627_9GAST|nr:hypothetical protein PoB_006615900 [Plakobranchus ocellatus]
MSAEMEIPSGALLVVNACWGPTVSGRQGPFQKGFSSCTECLTAPILGQSFKRTYQFLNINLKTTKTRTKTIKQQQQQQHDDLNDSDGKNSDKISTMTTTRTTTTSTTEATATSTTITAMTKGTIITAMLLSAKAVKKKNKSERAVVFSRQITNSTNKI